MQDQLWNAGEASATSNRVCREPGCERLARAKQGARYCEEHARSVDYGPITAFGWTEHAICPGCGDTFRKQRRRAYTITARAYESFCKVCVRMSPLSRSQLVVHSVPPYLVEWWLAQQGKLACDLCGRRLDRQTKSGQPTIDHDHRCCSGDKSCGECVRGVLCARCNSAVAHFERLLGIKTYEEIIAYVDCGNETVAQAPSLHPAT